MKEPYTLFSERLMMDIMHLKGKQSLHVVHSFTSFSAALFLSEVSTKNNLGYHYRLLAIHVQWPRSFVRVVQG